MQSKACDDLENLSTERINQLLAKNLIAANSLRRLSFESHHNLDIDKQLKHMETMSTIRRRSLIQQNM